jgi:hypothetical protein
VDINEFPVRGEPRSVAAPNLLSSAVPAVQDLALLAPVDGIGPFCGTGERPTVLGNDKAVQITVNSMVAGTAVVEFSTW